MSLFDVNQFQFAIKEDTFGLGYKRLDVNQLLSGNLSETVQEDAESGVASLLFPELSKKANVKANKKRGMTGQVIFY